MYLGRCPRLTVILRLWRLRDVPDRGHRSVNRILNQSRSRNRREWNAGGRGCPIRIRAD